MIRKRTLGELVDERAEPDLRVRFGLLARESAEITVAARHIRLAAVDLGAEEAQGLARIRVVLSELSAGTFRSEAETVMADPRRRAVAERLHGLLASGALEARVAPMTFWTPDFAVFHRDARPFAAVFGLHWFQQPFPHSGPAFATVCGRTGAEHGARRFAELWSSAHDVTEAVKGLLGGARKRVPVPDPEPDEV